MEKKYQSYQKKNDEPQQRPFSDRKSEECPVYDATVSPAAQSVERRVEK
jgi:hypothetical protein